MTIRIPRAVVYVLGTLAFVGVSVAGYLVFHEPARQCLTAAGSPVSCDAADSLSYSEYDVMKEQEEAAAEAEAAADECQQQTGGLQSSLEELDSRLTVGLAYDEYSTQVGDAQVAYDRVPIARLEQDCLFEVGVHLENAMNAYVKADNVWNDCIVDFGCDVDSIKPELQLRWAEATREIDKAKAGLAAIREAGEGSPSDFATD
jgi:hypothetical protein